jgi:hypothetical protein
MSGQVHVTRGLACLTMLCSPGIIISITCAGQAVLCDTAKQEITPIHRDHSDAAAPDLCECIKVRTECIKVRTECIKVRTECIKGLTLQLTAEQLMPVWVAAQPLCPASQAITNNTPGVPGYNLTVWRVAQQSPGVTCCCLWLPSPDNTVLHESPSSLPRHLLLLL